MTGKRVRTNNLTVAVQLLASLLLFVVVVVDDAIGASSSATTTTATAAAAAVDDANEQHHRYRWSRTLQREEREVEEEGLPQMNLPEGYNTDLSENRIVSGNKVRRGEFAFFAQGNGNSIGRVLSCE